MRVGISSRSLSPPPAESVLDLYSTVEVVQQQSGHSELTDNVQEILLEAQHNANYKDTLDCISGHGSIQASGREQMQTEACQREFAPGMVPT